MSLAPLAFATPIPLSSYNKPLTKSTSTASRCIVASHPHDAYHIRHAVKLAEKGLGQTRPNPPVGCVITSPTGKILGEGFHKKAGAPHAEVNALTDAASKGSSVQGATAYVSLEPCNHFGRTPPCSQALVDAGVARVVLGMVDPDPRTAGAGVKTLRDAGIHVTVGVEEKLCQRLNEGFSSRILRKRPFGIFKYAMTLDGKIASQTGSSKWVTGPEARSRVQEIRRGVDAIIVGGQTLRADNPQLTIRERNIGELAPLRVVMTKTMQLPLEARLWDTTTADTLVFADSEHGRPHIAAALREKGVKVVEIPGLHPDDAMATLYEYGCLNVLWECGGDLAASAMKSNAVQKIHAFIAPKIIGGHSPSPLGVPAIGLHMDDALQLSETQVETFDNGDLLVTGYLNA